MPKTVIVKESNCLPSIGGAHSLAHHTSPLLVMVLLGHVWPISQKLGLFSHMLSTKVHTPVHHLDPQLVTHDHQMSLPC